MSKRTIRLFLIVLLLTFSIPSAPGELVHAYANIKGVDSFFSRRDLRRLFLLKITHWNDGTPVTVVLYKDSIAQRMFYRSMNVTGYNLSTALQNNRALERVKVVEVENVSQAMRELTSTPGSVGLLYNFVYADRWSDNLVRIQ